MSKIVTNIKSKISINRRFIVLLIILSFIGFILFSAIGGSVTNPFDTSEENPEFQDSPNDVNLPNSNENGFNYSDFGDPPEGFNPPADLIGDLIGGGGIGSGGGGPSLEPPEDPNGGDDGFEIPPGTPPGNGNDGGGNDGNDGGNDGNDNDGPIDNPGPVNPNPSDNNDSGTDKNNSRDLINFPTQPNKARNLYNLSSIVLFPNSNSSVSINVNFPSLPTIGINNLFFLVLIFTILYIPKSVIARLIQETRDTDNEAEKDEQDSIFFTPDKSALELRREKERQRRLENFSDHIQVIINDMNEKLEQGINCQEIITSSYLQLDTAFSNFIDLKRDKAATPLEHAQEHFETHEISNKALNNIVNLFYLSRFGNKDMQVSHVKNFINQLDNLVLNEPKQEADHKSSWSIFR